MKRYSESLIYLMKAVSHSVFMYSCIYILPVLAFEVYTDKIYFLTGILCVLLSLFMERILNRLQKETFLQKYFLIFGVLVSVIISLAEYIWIQHELFILMLSIPYHTYLWKLGWELEDIKFSHEIFKGQFLFEFKVLALVSVAASLFLKAAPLQSMVQYLTAFIIISPVILRYSRDHAHMGTQRSKRAVITNIITFVFVILALLLVSTDNFLYYALIAAKTVYNAADSVISFIVYIIAYPIGYIVSALISLVQWLFGVVSEPQEQPQDGQHDIQQRPEANPWVLPDEVITILKIAVLLVLVLILVKILLGYRKKKLKSIRNDYTEKREFVLDLNGIGKDIGSSISSLFERKKKHIPETLRDRIRFLYENFLEICKLKGIYKKSSQTHRDIEKANLELLCFASSDICCISEVYEKARYSADELSEDDYNTAAGSLENIKNGNLKGTH